jgi:hypothetical protein
VSCYLHDGIFSIGGNAIEFVKSFSHLGHIISAVLDDSADIAEKKNDFINQTNNI